MIIFKTKTELSNYLSSVADSCVGFVPTMGALHKGHFSLLREAKKQSTLVVCSIFVNPTQFNTQKDFNKYPNMLSQDLSFLEKLNCDVVYMPEVADLYGENEKRKHYDFDGLENEMEGKFRKGHFDGVATVIEKFFKIIAPQKAFFGQKDLQQLLIIRSLTRKLNLSIEIIDVPTVREKSGLAMSSRNKLLNAKQLEKAALLYKALLFCKNKKGSLSMVDMKNEVLASFTKEGITLEYLTFSDSNTLKILPDFNSDSQTAVCIAAYIAGVRLIDNIIF